MIPRDFATVLEAVIAEVPVDQAELRRRLTKILADVGFQPPEARWQHLGWKVEAAITEAMSVPLVDLSEGWRAKVIAAWMGAEAEG